MDNSSHTLLDLLLEEDMDRFSYYERNYNSFERPVIRSMSMYETLSPQRRPMKQMINRFDAVAKDCHHEQYTNVSNQAFRDRRMSSPRRPERQASFFVYNETDLSIHPDKSTSTAVTTCVTKNLIHTRPSPSIVYIQGHGDDYITNAIKNCSDNSTGSKKKSTSTTDSISRSLITTKTNSSPTVVAVNTTKQKALHSFEDRNTSMPRRPMRQVSGISPVVIIDTQVFVIPPTILGTTVATARNTATKSMVPKRENSPRRPMRRPSVS